MREIWKPIKDFEEKYAISNYGRLKNIQTSHILKMTNQYGGYFSVILYDKVKKRYTRIHRLVAETFIPDKSNFKSMPYENRSLIDMNKLEVNHKDTNKQNNRVNNLEWCTKSYNSYHASKNTNSMSGFNKYNKNKCHLKYGYIYQFDINMNFIDKYYDVSEAHKNTNICVRNILQCINHEPKRKTAGGYIWLCESEVIECGIKI